MNFDYTDKVKDMQARLLAFMDAHIYPNEKRFFAEIAENRGMHRHRHGGVSDVVIAYC